VACCSTGLQLHIAGVFISCIAVKMVKWLKALTMGFLFASRIRGIVMKAKMTDKPPEVGRYLCNKCQKAFHFKGGVLTCPACHNVSRSDMVVIGINDNPAEEQMYTEGDWHGG
jgi:hypothetical protein